MNELPPLADLHAALDPDERWRRYCESLHTTPGPRCIYAESSGPPCEGEVAERYDPFSVLFDTHMVCVYHQNETVAQLREQMAAYYHDRL